jgi:cellulose synthase/poly-beta-1,6-N-acetylglucosamine synthase-like glycosyltransferase
LFYTYIGYGLTVACVVWFKRITNTEANFHVQSTDLPDVTVVIAAYNEKNCLAAKIENTLAQDYPKDKLHVLVVTDGSDDGSEQIAAQYNEVVNIHQTERQGKSAALNRAMQYVQTPIVIFTDANTILNVQAVKLIANCYADGRVGAVAGEKRISKTKENTTTAQEGLYWRYESLMKRLDSQLHSVIGAAGELFSIRTNLFRTLDRSIILDDFVLSISVIDEGYRIAYQPDAWAEELPSISLRDEYNRKVRIAAGGYQVMRKLGRLLNPFQYGWVSFQYFWRKIARWTLAPLALLGLLCWAIFLPLPVGEMEPLYAMFRIGQYMFYILGVVGWAFSSNAPKMTQIAFYFIMMHWAALAGGVRYCRGKQSVLWAKAQR